MYLCNEFPIKSYTQSLIIETVAVCISLTVKEASAKDKLTAASDWCNKEPQKDDQKPCVHLIQLIKYIR